VKKTLRTFNTLIKSNIGESHPHGSAKKGNKIYYTTRTSPAKLVEVTLLDDTISTRSITLHGNKGESIAIHGNYAFVPTDEYLNVVDLSTLSIVHYYSTYDLLPDLHWAETRLAENTVVTPDGYLFVGWTLRYVVEDVLAKFKIKEDGDVELVDKVILEGKGSCHAMRYYNGYIYAGQGYNPEAAAEYPDRVRKITKDLKVVKTVRLHDSLGVIVGSTDDLSICNGKIYIIPEFDHRLVIFDQDLNIVKSMVLPSPDPDPNAPFFGGMGNDVLNDRYVIIGPTEKTTTLYVVDSTDDSLELVECGFSWGEEVTVIDNKIAMVNWDGDFILGYLEEEMTKTLQIESIPKSKVYVDGVYAGLT